MLYNIKKQTENESEEKIVKEQQGNSKTKIKKPAGEIVSKILSVICVICAVILAGVTAIAVANNLKTKAPDTGDSAPEVITTEATTESTTAITTTEPSTTETTTAEPSTTEATTESTTEATTTEITQAAAESNRKVVKLDQKHWSVVIVDKDRQMPDGYVPELEFVANSDYALDSRVAKYYTKMYNDAYEEGIVLTPYSAYRSYESQNNNFNSLADSYISQGYSVKEAEELAATEILPPGCSEHNLGFAMDICGTEDSFKETAEYKWLCENAHKYGFIERYPEGKQSITGVIPEPWHWRFIGPAYAEDMRSRGCSTLEEYLQSYDVNY